jgi:hypothetical protein
MWLQGFVELIERDTTFDFTPESCRADRSDAAQRRRMNNDPTLGSNRPTRQRSAGSTDANGDIELFGTFQHPDHFVSVGRNHDRIRAEGFVAQPVGVVSCQLRRGGQHAAANTRLFEDSINSIRFHSVRLHKGFHPRFTIKVGDEI